MNKNKQIAARFQNLRMKNGLSQRDLASILDVCNTTISNYEKGVKAIPFIVLVATAKYFGVDLNYFDIEKENLSLYEEKIKKQNDKINELMLLEQLIKNEIIYFSNKMQEYKKQLKQLNIP